MKLSQFKTARERRLFLEKTLKVDLDTIGSSLMDDEHQVHVENIIGATTIPLGVAGPLKINGEQVKGDFFVPLATTEGALVASISRGCKAITQAGGTNVVSSKVGATRGPVFYVKNLKEARKLEAWIQKNESKIKESAESTSSHLKYLHSKITTSGNYVFVRFSYDTGDAMGMNMVTIATEKVTALISNETKVHCLALAGNYDIDKKAAWLNVIENRGFKILADVVLPESVLSETLKTTAKEFFDIWLAKCMVGSALSGSLGFNAHFANVIAAIFAATGQDLAHTVEGSLGLTTTKVVSRDLYVSVYLPSLMMGTVGGGTGLKTQKEALTIVGVKKSAEFAEVVGAAVLAGEISLLSAIAQGSLARAHEKLGR